MRKEGGEGGEPPLDLYFNLLIYPGREYFMGRHAPFQQHPASHGGHCTHSHLLGGGQWDWCSTGACWSSLLQDLWVMSH